MFSKILLITSLVAAALARPDKLPSSGFGNGGYQVPQPPQRSYSQPAQEPRASYSQPQPTYRQEVVEEGMPFNYNYEVKDEYSGNDFGHNTDSDGDVTKGEYRVLLPDGRTQIVSYVSTKEDGYKAEVRYEGEIKLDQAQRGAYSNPQPTYQQPAPSQAYQQPPQRSQDTYNRF